MLSTLCASHDDTSYPVHLPVGQEQARGNMDEPEKSSHGFKHHHPHL